MKYELENKSQCKRVIKITVPAKEAGAEFDKQADIVRKNVALPGFRKGKAPMNMVLGRFESEIKEQVINDLIPEQFKLALKEAELEPVSEPVVNEDVKFEKGSPFVFEVSFEVLPDIKPEGYKGIELEKSSVSVKAKEVNEFLENLRERVAEMKPVEDRPSRKDDFIYIDMKGHISGEDNSFEHENASLQIGMSGLPQSFEKEVTGLKTGDEKSFSVEFPKDFEDETVAGKKVDYTIKVNSIKEKVLPPLDDSFAKMITDDIESLEELKKKTKEDLVSRRTSEVEAKLREDIVAKLCELNKFEVPDIFVENQKNDQLRELVNNFASQGIKPEESSIDWKQIRENGHDRAVAKVKADLVLQAIADIENIKVEKDEMNEEIEKIAKVLNQPKAKLKAEYIKSGVWNDLKYSLRSRKTIDFVLENAKITEVKDDKGKKNKKNEKKKEGDK